MFTKTHQNLSSPSLVPSLSSSMDFATNYEIAGVAEFIRSRNYSRVSLQFPDELLKDAAGVAKALKDEIGRGVRFYVMADTVYGSCCVDEVGASHVDADCVVHFGHACMSPTSKLPAKFVFGKAPVDIDACSECLHRCLVDYKKPILVLYGLEYAYAMQTIKSETIKTLEPSISDSVLQFADVTCSFMSPLKDDETNKGQGESHECVVVQNDITNIHADSEINFKCDERSNQNSFSKNFRLGGLSWSLPEDRKLEDYLLFWIGSENSAFANIVLTYNSCNIVRFNMERNHLVEDLSDQKKILKRRYYLVEKAKDANIVGILVGTLGIAGYLHMIKQIKDLIEGAGKKAYTFIMGRPNPAKVANFPECDVFVYVSCPQTALMDSKEFLAPIITPFEAMLAFKSESEWTGEYHVEFRDIMMSSAEPKSGRSTTKEARFSFLLGGYVEDAEVQDDGDEQKERSTALAEATEKALCLEPEEGVTNSILFKGAAKSGAEFFAARSYRGLDMQYEDSSSDSFIIGKSGKASGYDNEKNKA